jgi:outer membrane protein assembly factor BamB
MSRQFLLTVIFCLLAVPALAEENAELRERQWHHWRGPHANGVAPHGNPPVEWSETKNIKWKQEIPGRGSATPIVWEDRIIVVTAREIESAEQATATAQPQRTTAEGSVQVQQPPQDGPGGRPRGGSRAGVRGGFGAGRGSALKEHEFLVLCLERSTGKVLWEKAAAKEVPHERLHETNTHASASPTTDGKQIYVSFGSRGIFCYDMEGNLKWTRNLGRMATRNAFGEGSSPTIWGEVLLVNWDHEGDSFLVALHAQTGEDLWRVERDEVSTWFTPLVVEHEGTTQVITNGTNRARSYDLASGELLWECGGQVSNPIASPIVHDGVAYCMTGHRGQAVYAIPLDARGDITDSEKILWSRQDTGPYIASPVLYGDLLYVTKGRDAILTCLDPKTGEPQMPQQRLPELNILYASPVATAGRIYYVDRNGTTLILQHGKELRVLAINKLDEGIDASPVIVDNQLLLRGEQHLYCIEVTP